MSGKIVGYTTGVYDLFHIGHVNILRRAKENCDYLIVGVTTDELAFAAKNKQPVFPFEDRCNILKSIRYVDEVVLQDSYDKMAAWEKYQFNVMFVGDDWKGSEKGKQLEIDFAERGVKIVYFPYTSTISSTKIRSQLSSKQE